MLTNEDSDYIDFKCITLALRVATKKLRPYFQAYTINVFSSYPIRVVLYKPDVVDRLLKWAIKLSEFDIVGHSRSGIKGKVLAYFITKLFNTSRDKSSRQL